MWRHDDRPEELATTTEVSAEEDDTEDSTTKTDESAGEAEETTRLSERLWRRVAMLCLWEKGIDNDNNVIGGGRPAQGPSDDNGDVGRGQGIDNTSEGSEKTMEAAGARRQARGLSDDDEGVGGGRLSQNLQ